MVYGTWLSRFATSVALGALLIAGATTARAGDESVSADPAIAPLTDMHSVYMSMVPQSPYVTLQHRPASIPLLTGVDRATWFARKAAARYNRLAPYDPRPIPAWYGPFGGRVSAGPFGKLQSFYLGAGFPTPIQGTFFGGPTPVVISNNVTPTFNLLPALRNANSNGRLNVSW